MVRLTSMLLGAALVAASGAHGSSRDSGERNSRAAFDSATLRILRDSGAIRRKIEAFLTEQNRLASANLRVKNALSGAVIVTVDGKLLLAKAFGYANREWEIPATTDTKFRIWSVTKTFTAIGVMQLVERNRISIDD